MKKIPLVGNLFLYYKYNKTTMEKNMFVSQRYNKIENDKNIITLCINNVNNNIYNIKEKE